MALITFFYRDGRGRTTATSKAVFSDEKRAIAAARLDLSEQDYHDVELWDGERLVAKLERREAGVSLAS